METFSPGSKVGIVLVAYNSPEHLDRCIESIRSGSHQNFEIIVIDNSTMGDGSSPLSIDPKIHYRKTEDNLGFCTATNLGIATSRRLGTDYTLILNYDTILVTDTLEKLIAAAESLKNPGIVGGKIFYTSEPGRLWYAGGYLSLLQGVGKHFGHGEKDSGQYDVSGNVTYVTGCCMLVPTRVFSEIGGLKDELFMYLDDAEFCLRVQDSGKVLYYESSAHLYHAVGPGSERIAYPDYYLYFSIRNKPYITSKFFYRMYLHVFTFVLTLSKLWVYGVASRVSERGTKLKAIVWGWLDSFSLKPKYRKRFPRLFRQSHRETARV